MSKTIKTITTLKKHVGDTVHVVSYDGYEFDAKILDNLRCGHTGLFTTDKKASKDTYWWPSDLGYGHVTEKPYQLKEELKSVELVKAKETKRKEDATKAFVSDEDLIANDPEATEFKKPFLTREQLLENIGKRCEMSDGTEGLIVKTDIGNPRILMHTRVNGHGWLYSEASEDDTGASLSVKSKYAFGWNVCDDSDAEDISVVKILDDDKCAESSKTILDMTIREVLEKLNEIVIS